MNCYEDDLQLVVRYVPFSQGWLFKHTTSATISEQCRIKGSTKGQRMRRAWNFGSLDGLLRPGSEWCAVNVHRVRVVYGPLPHRTCCRPPHTHTSGRVRKMAAWCHISKGRGKKRMESWQACSTADVRRVERDRDRQTEREQERQQERATDRHAE